MTSGTRFDALPRALRLGLERSFGDRLVKPADAGYDEGRRVWNARIDRRPSVIVPCATAGDLGLVVGLCREHDAVLAVRGGGHSVGGFGIAEGGVLADLSAFSAIDVDAAARIARVGGGLSWGPVDRATAAHGLATVGGQISTTGVGGLTVGGGVGWLMRKHGLTVDNLRSARVVGADGEHRLVSAETDADLFWAIRGGGSNFGIVTSFEFDLHPVSTVLAGTMLYALEDAARIMATFVDVAATAPNEATLMVLLLAAPDQPHIPAEHRGHPIALVAVCYAGDPGDGADIVDPFRATAPPLADSVRPMPYVDFQSLFDEGSRAGFFNTWRSPFLERIDSDLIDHLVRLAGEMPTAGSQILLANMGGAVADVADGETAFCQRQAPFYVEGIGKWAAGEEPGPATAWADEFERTVEPWSTGYTYVNFLDSTDPRGAARAYDPPTLQRLRALKRRYDPDNVFRSNINIDPGA